MKAKAREAMAMNVGGWLPIAGSAVRVKKSLLAVVMFVSGR